MGKRIKALLISMAVLLVAMVSLASCGKRTYSVMFKSGTESIPGIRGMRGGSAVCRLVRKRGVYNSV